MKPYMTKTYLQLQTKKEVEELLDAPPAEIDLQNHLARIRTFFVFLERFKEKSNELSSWLLLELRKSKLRTCS